MIRALIEWQPQMHTSTLKLVYTYHELLHISANYAAIIRDIMHLIFVYFTGIILIIATQLAEHVGTMW